MNELELVICNGIRCVSEPVDESKAEPRPEVNITDAQLLVMCILMLECPIILEQQIRRWRLGKFGDDVVSVKQRLRPFQRELVRWREEELKEV